MLVLYNKIKNHFKNNFKNKKSNINKKRLLDLLLKINDFKNYNKPYKFFKQNYNPIIPLNIFQTWYTKNLPEHMNQRVELLKSQHPRFNHYLFDDNDCREFIKNNYNHAVLNTYDKLIPGAYKADLWRYCILYKMGGIYLDIKLCCINGFRLIELTENEHYVKDRPLNSIFNSLMVCQKGNLFLLKAINKIVENTNNNFYGNSPLSPTGPIMLGNLIVKNRYRLNVDMKHYTNGGYIIYKNRFVISTEYPEYDSERTTQYDELKTKRYDKLWHEKNIYLK
jgi:mannosyltransferase OCH1-like enzyme